MKRFSPNTSLVSIIVIIISAWFILLVPFAVLGHGFLPSDDALRHSAKVISGRDWSDILVLRDGMAMDIHAGWHAILGLAHKITGWDAHSLVLFSVVFLFLFFCLPPLFLLRRPEAWVLTLFITLVLYPGFIWRLLLGRPYIWTMSAFALILLIGPYLTPAPGIGQSPSQKNSRCWNNACRFSCRWIALLFITFIIALSVWIHGCWYVFALPVAAFFIAGKRKESLVLAIASLAGIIIGTILTGHPVVFLRQMLLHLFLVFGSNNLQRTLVTELRPALGSTNIIFAAAILIIFRMLADRRTGKLPSNIRVLSSPAFVMTGIAFILGLATNRAWLDWGLPAFAVWMAEELGFFLDIKIPAYSGKRIVIAVLSGIALYIGSSSDVADRWSMTRPLDYIQQNDTKQREWLPGPGGIIYSDDMGVFFKTFYKNPHAPWKYALGFESALMPDEDLKTLRNIEENFGDPKYYEPWVKKMRPSDRLVVIGREGSPPKIEGLEWHYICLNTWIGRKPRK